MNQRKQINILEDYDKMDESGLWLKSWTVPTGIVKLYEVHHSLSSQRWGSIQRRVNNTANRPTYEGCTNDFDSFQIKIV